MFAFQILEAISLTGLNDSQQPPCRQANGRGPHGRDE